LKKHTPIQQLLDGYGPLDFNDFVDEAPFRDYERATQVPVHMKSKTKKHAQRSPSHGIYKLYYYYSRWLRYRVKYFDSVSNKYVSKPTNSTATKVPVTADLGSLGIVTKNLVNAWKIENE
jgi:hypothetical protein